MNLKTLEQQIREYVPPVGIHAHPCKHCPSIVDANNRDPECREIMTWRHKDRVETAFACAWRTTKHCKGYCDLMGISEEDLSASIEPVTP